jgi:phosphotransferase system HPr-like phosphotransfer protein
LQVTAEGPDEGQALETMCRLIGGGFGEVEE